MLLFVTGAPSGRGNPWYEDRLKSDVVTLTREKRWTQLSTPKCEPEAFSRVKNMAIPNSSWLSAGGVALSWDTDSRIAIDQAMMKSWQCQTLWMTFSLRDGGWTSADLPSHAIHSLGFVSCAVCAWETSCHAARLSGYRCAGSVQKNKTRCRATAMLGSSS